MLISMQKGVHLELENIGCLRHIEIDLKPGLNIIKAPNASGKTSLIRGLISMFSDRIPPEHIISFGSLNGGIRLNYEGETYERTFNRTLSGSVAISGEILPFADTRAFDSCVAMAETGVVHKITGGGNAFREYLENLSYGRYYSEVISTAQELVNDLSRELAGPEFERFEALPLLLTELTELHIERELIKENIENLRANHEIEVQKLLKELENRKSALQKEEMKLAELERNLIREVEKERQLLSFLELTEDSSKAVAQMESAVADSRNSQKEIRGEIEKQTQLREDLEAEISTLRSRAERKKAEEVKGLKHEEEKLERTAKAIVIKEEDIEQAERFPPDNPGYPGRLVIEVRREIGKKIEWLNKVIEHFQEKYMRRMTTARLRFNRNITRAFEQLDLEGFANIFLDQDFALHIVRESSLQQPVETLSASERLTISLILMLAAKETFLPDFPFFIVDELTLSYDPERFRYIMNYIQQHVAYVIVTTLTSTGERGELEVTFGP